MAGTGIQRMREGAKNQGYPEPEPDLVTEIFGHILVTDWSPTTATVAIYGKHWGKTMQDLCGLADGMSTGGGRLHNLKSVEW